MFDPSRFTTPKAKPMPVFLLLDASGSMGEVIDSENVRLTGRTFEDDGQLWDEVEGGTSKMEIMNEAIKKMLHSFVDAEHMETEFLISIIVFGDRARQHIPPTSASSVKWSDMTADGYTAMGEAFSLVKALIEDKEIVPARAYRPTVILVSDGEPTDKWQHPLKALIAEGRSSKCFFMAMGIGDDPGVEVLERFISKTPVLAEINGKTIRNTVFRAADADKIHEFFRKVTMSVTTRSKSQNPNAVPTSTKPNLEEGGYW